MLREVRGSVLGLRLLPFSMTYASGVPVVGLGKNSFTVADTGSGKCTFNLNNPFKTGTVAVATRTSGTDNGYVEVLSSTITNKSIELDSKGADGSGFEDSGYDGVFCGWDSTADNIIAVPKFPVICGLDRPRIIGCQYNGSTSTLNIGKGEVSVAKTTTGDYTVTFKRAFGRPPAVMVSAIGTYVICEVPTATKLANSVRVLGFNASTAAPADVTFNLIAIGTDSGQLETSGRGILQGHQRKGRILVAGARPSATTSLLQFGSGRGIAGLTDLGQGDLRLTYNQPFAREPVVVVVGCNNGTTCQVRLVSVSSTICRFVCINGSESAQDDTVEGHVFIYGSDDATEY